MMQRRNSNMKRILNRLGGNDGLLNKRFGQANHVLRYRYTPRGHKCRFCNAVEYAKVRICHLGYTIRKVVEAKFRRTFMMFSASKQRRLRVGARGISEFR